ncbi:unnamed protein product [Owenia fusiformis]|uniref:Contactin n=1 Tax=Owenia fusiformis TaxID=6347 RepID=A0A8S4NRN2_OWEFU|nr:unnamed protein product [Owenia fusiformis]
MLILKFVAFAAVFIPESLGQIFDCPPGWREYLDRCYRFQRFPYSDLAGAKISCSDNGATLLSVNDNGEHGFVEQTFNTIDPGPGRQRWYTSGRRNPSRPWQYYWEGDGTDIQRFEAWKDDTEKEKPTPDNIMYAWDGNKWAWHLVDQSEQLPFICEISKSDVYKILEGERDFDYGVENPDPNTIPRGPVLQTEPESTIYDTDSSEKVVRLMCDADAYPPADYTWYKDVTNNKVEINANTNSRYTFTNGDFIISDPVETNDNGAYQCSARNEFGSILSNDVRLTFGFLQDFSKTKRSPIDVDAYTGTSIECKPPSTNYAILFQWYKDNTNNFIRPRLKPHAFISNNGRLYFSFVTRDDYGDYYCMVKRERNAQGGKSSMPTLMNVKEAIATTQEPRLAQGFPQAFPNDVKRGTNIRLECFAWGTGILEYSWVREDGNGNPVDMPVRATYLEDDHKRVIIIPDVQMEDAGVYKCSVQRVGGLSTSGSVRLTLNSDPYFTLPLRDQHVDLRGSLVWRCEANSVPAATYSWYKNAEILNINSIPPADRQRITISNNVLTISTIEDRDKGMYQCAASNQYGTRFSTGQLRVLAFAPTFAKYPLVTNQYATRGGNITILCNPEAAPKPEIIWRKNNQIMNPSPDEGARVRLLPSNAIFISSVDSSDMGRYSCEATNELGKAISYGNLTVVSSTTIARGPIGATVRVNRTLVLMCQASVNPVLDYTYIWKHNNRKIDFYKEISPGNYIVNEYFARGETWNSVGYLYLVNAQLWHEGQYTCYVETQVDMKGSSADVVVVGPPGEPGGLYGDQITNTSMRLRWQPGAGFGRPVTTYVMEGFNRHIGYWAVMKTNIKPLGIGSNTERPYTYLTNLSPWSSYRFRVRAENDLGTGPSSVPSPEYTTNEAVPTVPAGNVGGGGGKVGDLTITWDSVPEVFHNGQGFGYIVQWREPGQSDKDWIKRELIGGQHSQYVYTVGEDNFWKPYEVMVQTMNNVGLGPTSEIKTIMSAENIPLRQPTNVRAQQYNATALLVSWDKIEEGRETTRGLLYGYRITYWKRDIETEELGIRQTVNGKVDSGFIIGLNPNTFYVVNVMAFNSAGNSPKSEDFPQRTLRSAPVNAPEEVNVITLTTTSIEVIWRGVITDQTQEPLQGYKVVYWKQGETMKNAMEADAGRNTMVRIHKLEPEVIYILRVLGYSRGGDGAKSWPEITFSMVSSSTIFHPSSIIITIATILSTLWRHL